MFLARDISPHSCHGVAKSSKIGSFWPTNFWEPIPEKSLGSVLLPTDTHHASKFRKDPFRGVDGIDSKKHLQNRCRCLIGYSQLSQVSD